MYRRFDKGESTRHSHPSKSGKVKRIEEERIEEERIEERNILCWLVSIKGSLT